MAKQNLPGLGGIVVLLVFAAAPLPAASPTSRMDAKEVYEKGIQMLFVENFGQLPKEVASYILYPRIVTFEAYSVSPGPPMWGDVYDMSGRRVKYPGRGERPFIPTTSPNPLC